MFYIPISMPFIGQFLSGPLCNEKTDVLDNYNIYILVFLDYFVSACLVRALIQTRQVVLQTKVFICTSTTVLGEVPSLTLKVRVVLA